MPREFDDMRAHQNPEADNGKKHFPGNAASAIAKIADAAETTSSNFEISDYAVAARRTA